LTKELVSQFVAAEHIFVMADAEHLSFQQRELRITELEGINIKNLTNTSADNAYISFSLTNPLRCAFDFFMYPFFEYLRMDDTNRISSKQK